MLGLLLYKIASYIHISVDLLSKLKEILNCKEVEIMNYNSWLRIKGYAEQTQEHADVYYFRNNLSSGIELGQDLDEPIDVYTLWIALSDIPNSAIAV